ncbi:MAG: hypothetical protein EOO75_16270 [Myxococcales bacterium]|nr:MAG: hypothetical protein EOO75_16270 [Myxococcales bacterium]
MTVSFLGNRLAMVLVAGAAVAAVAGCNKSEAAPARTDRGQQVKGDAAAGQARVEADEYVVEIKAVGPFAKGKETRAEVVIRSKGEFHVNDQYPHKFVAREVDGVSFVKSTVKRDDGKVDAATVTLPLTFTPSKDGKFKIGGIAHFSVCSDKNCLMPKPDLELTIDVP